MIIADCPSEMENKRNIVFGGKSSNNLRKALESRDIDLDEIYFTYAVKCPVPEDKEPSPAHLKVCIDYLLAEIDVVNPEIIVPMGNIAMKAVLGKVGLMKNRGKAVVVDNRIILPTYHPRATLRKPAYKDFLLKDLDTLADLYKNGMNQTSTVLYKVLDNWQDCISELDKLEDGCLNDPEKDWLVFDIETTGKNPFTAKSKIVCISLTNEERNGITIPLYHKESPLWGDERGVVVKRLKKLLENPDVKKAAHNGKFDIKWLKVFLGITVKRFVFDTMFAHYIAVSEELGTQGLKGLAWEYTDMGGYDNELDEFRAKLPEDIRYNYDNIPWDILSKYAAADVDCTLRLLHIFLPMIEENEKWKILMEQILMPACWSITNMEISGMYMDDKLAEWYKTEYDTELNRIKDRLESYPEVIEIEREKLEMYAQRQAILKSVPAKDRTEEQKQFVKNTQKYKDYKFNWSSVQQLQDLLFNRLKLVTTIKTDTGAFSTGAEALEEMSTQHEIPNLMFEYRKISTLNNMFIQKLPDLRDETGHIHPSFNPTGTVTGRMSSEDPNAQQFPRKSEDPTLFQYHHEPKKLFISRFGDNGCILQFDYSQLELRVAGMISGDQNLLKIYLSGQDLHKATASMVWGVPIDEVGKEMRTNAKAVNFGIVYGKSGITFAKDLYSDMPWEQAKKAGFKLVDDYLKTFPELAKWIEDAKKFAKKHGYAETMFGRRRRLPDLKSKDTFIQSEAERQSVNAPIQGTGSDLTMKSIVLIDEFLQKYHMKSKMICTVHDSIVFDVYLPELPELFEFIKHTMEHVHELYFDTDVPLVAEAELGDSYGNSFDIDTHMDINNPKLFKEWLNSVKQKKHDGEIEFLRNKKKFTEAQIERYLAKYSS